MIIFKTSALYNLSFLPYILGTSETFKMSVNTFENNGKSINENVVKLKLEHNIKSLLYNHLVYIPA